jgi:hypothetical protein
LDRLSRWTADVEEESNQPAKRAFGKSLAGSLRALHSVAGLGAIAGDWSS